MAIVAAVGIGSPFLDRWVIRRRRIQYQVLYNSKIGLDTVFRERDEDEDSAATPVNPLVGRLVHELEHLSQMIIRIRNVGGAHIGESDIQPPLSMEFGNRIIWNARISEASVDELRTHIRSNMEFFTHVGWLTNSEIAKEIEKDDDYSYRDLAVVRHWLVQRLAKALTQAPDETQPEETASADREPRWHGLRLANLWLRRGQSFILMVVLREAVDNTDDKISKDYQVTGGRGDGDGKRRTIIQRRRQGWFRWQSVTTVIGVVVVGALLGTLLAKFVIGAQPTVVPGVPCVTGTANLSGSSAFGPIVQTIGDDYMAACPGSQIVVNSTGSIDGVRSLTNNGPHSAATQAALSDGPSAEAPDGMGRQQLVVLVYALLINKGVGIDHLTTAQVLGIYSGKYTNWSQLGGPFLPIRIVAREGSSGTRLTFEKYVLHGSEGNLSSNSCESKDRVPSEPTVLCELPTTKDVVNNVATIPGAIGYADSLNQDTKNAVSGNRIVRVVLDNHYPGVGSLPDYPYWTVEYLYTWTPGTTSPIGAFVDYLKSDPAQTTLRAAGYTPCVAPGGSLDPLCTQR